MNELLQTPLGVQFLESPDIKFQAPAVQPYIRAASQQRTSSMPTIVATASNNTVLGRASSTGAVDSEQEIRLFATLLEINKKVAAANRVAPYLVFGTDAIPQEPAMVPNH